MAILRYSTIAAFMLATHVVASPISAREYKDTVKLHGQCTTSPIKIGSTYDNWRCHQYNEDAALDLVCHGSKLNSNNKLGVCVEGPQDGQNPCVILPAPGSSVSSPVLISPAFWFGDLPVDCGTDKRCTGKIHTQEELKALDEMKKTEELTNALCVSVDTDELLYYAAYRAA